MSFERKLTFQFPTLASVEIIGAFQATSHMQYSLIKYTLFIA